MEHYKSDEFWCIYYHMNKVNGKIYLGISNNTRHRFGGNGNGYKGCRYFWSAIQKYGWDGFDHKILLTDLTHEQAKLIEIELIKKYDLRNRSVGYNISKGGDSGPGLKGENHPKSKTIYQYSLDGNYIREWVNSSEAARQLHIRSGVIITSAKHKGNRQAGGYLWSYIKKDKIYKYQKLENHNARKEYPRIYCVNFHGELEKIYNDVHNIENYNKQQYSYILECCRGKQLSFNDRFWIFEEDYSKEKVDELIQMKFNNTNSLRKKQMICMYDLSGNFIKTFLSKFEASEYANVPDYLIYNACQNVNGTHRGANYLWYFYNDTNGENIRAYSKKHVTTPIYQYDTNGVFVEYYIQAKYAKQKYGTTINKALKSKSHYAYGYLWFYQSDFEKYKQEFNLEDPK